MELRLLEFAARVLDPRRARTRLKQAAALLALTVTVWVRAVRRTDAARVALERSHERRAAQAQERLAAREATVRARASVAAVEAKDEAQR